MFFFVCSCNKPLRNVDYLILDVPFSRTGTFKNSFFMGFVAHGMNYPLKLESLTPCQSFVRNCLLIFMLRSELNRNYLIFIKSLE